MSYSMLPMSVKKIEFSVNLNNYNIDKIEVYTFDELLNKDKLLIENIDYKLEFIGNKTIFENISNQKIKRISIYRDPNRYKYHNINRIEQLYGTYYDNENKRIANYTGSGDTNIYHVGFPDRRNLIK